ncbi:MAG: hypothetical protein ABI114_06130 [Rhodanobacter sp.]
MIELEIQGLAESREGLLIEMSRFILATGFTLRRQRLLQDPHGILLTMVVYGSARKQRALEKLLDSYERLISFNVSPLLAGETRPHFAASLPPSTYRPDALPPAVDLELPVVAVPAVPVATQHTDQPKSWPVDQEVSVTRDQSTEFMAPAMTNARGELRAWQEEPDFELIQPNVREPQAERVAPVETTPFIEVVPLGPDEAAVEKALRSLEYDYPRQLLPRLLTLQAEVADAARESSLELAGQRTGAWVFAREQGANVGLELLEAISRIGAPTLRALIEVDQQDAQLHLLNSPLCATDGHSGCSFFRGFLEGLLGPATAPHTLSIFPVCCRSYGANECVFEISE